MNKQHSRLQLLPIVGTAGVLFFSCMATPPSSVLAFDGGRVRAADAVEAERIETLMARLRPQLLELLPDADFEDLEVWVQERPTLYRFSTEATSDAEGLWSPSHRRIMLSRHADHLERTLAHELTHAVLGDSWQLLPGSLEEGLADHVSAAVCDDGAARLRAGRLSSACLATGGLEIDVDVMRRVQEDGKPSALRRGWSARVKLKGETETTDPLDVFRLSAGLSSTRLDVGTKRGFYGLAFLVVKRIVDREGYSALHDLCKDASAEGLSHVAMQDVLDAAGLGREPDEWRRAAAQAMGPEEVIELVRMYPDFLVDALVDYTRSLETSMDGQVLDTLDVQVSLVEGGASISLERLPFVRKAVLEELQSTKASAMHVAVAR